MAMQTFNWEPDDEIGTDSTFRVRRSQFGDGYVQVAGDGLNPETDTHTLTFGGLMDEIKPIVDFIRAHGGARSFLWTTPEGSWACTAVQTAAGSSAPAALSCCH